MKLSVIIAGSAAACVVAYNAYSLTCGAQPSCSSLGYTYTGSTSDCIGTALKCPFNSSYFNCTKKTDVTGAVMPNYSGRQGRSAGVQYTASSDGYLIGVDFQEGNKGCGVTVNIGGVNVRVDNQQTNWGRNSWSYPVKKGALYNVTLDNRGCAMSYYFVPLN